MHIVQPENLGFPDEEYMSTSHGIPENHFYMDLRGYGCSDFERIWRQEQEILSYIEENGEDSDALYERFSDNEVYMLGLDPGVASTVIALAAIEAVPVTSCSGGAGHYETHPLVMCWCSHHQLELMLLSAKETGIEIEGVAKPGVLVYTLGDVEEMRHFAMDLFRQACRSCCK